jgi:ComF family protein
MSHLSRFSRMLPRRAAAHAASFLFPPLCTLCDQPRDTHAGAWFCQPCLDSFARNAAARAGCPRCGLDARVRACGCALAWDYPFDSIFAVFDFDETVKKAVYQFKYMGRRDLARELGRLFADRLPESLLDADWFIPAPLHWRRRLRRGYNQSDDLARGFLQAHGLEHKLAPRALIRRRHTSTQTKLDRSRRRENLHGAFALHPSFADAVRAKRIVLVDDVVTTGSTAGACTEALLNRGAASVRILALARD